MIHDLRSALGFNYAIWNESNVKALTFMEALLVPIPSWVSFPEDFEHLK